MSIVNNGGNKLPKPNYEYVTTDERVRVAQKKKWLEAQVKKKNGRG